MPFNRQNRLAYKPMTNLLDVFFGDAWRPYNLLNVTFKLDVREELLHYTVEAEMPGVQKEDIGKADTKTGGIQFDFWIPPVACNPAW